MLIIYRPAPSLPYEPKTILRFENEDCVVLGNNTVEMYISIDHISDISIFTNYNAIGSGTRLQFHDHGFQGKS
jgi:hypothetical protein